MACLAMGLFLFFFFFFGQVYCTVEQGTLEAYRATFFLSARRTAGICEFEPRPQQLVPK